MREEKSDAAAIISIANASTARNVNDKPPPPPWKAAAKHRHGSLRRLPQPWEAFAN